MRLAADTHDAQQVSAFPNLIRIQDETPDPVELARGSIASNAWKFDDRHGLSRSAERVTKGSFGDDA